MDNTGLYMGRANITSSDHHSSLLEETPCNYIVQVTEIRPLRAKAVSGGWNILFSCESHAWQTVWYYITLPLACSAPLAPLPLEVFRSAVSTIAECLRVYSVAYDPGDSTGAPPWRKIGLTTRKLSLGF